MFKFRPLSRQPRFGVKVVRRYDKHFLLSTLRPKVGRNRKRQIEFDPVHTKHNKICLNDDNKPFLFPGRLNVSPRLFPSFFSGLHLSVSLLQIILK